MDEHKKGLPTEQVEAFENFYKHYLIITLQILNEHNFIKIKITLQVLKSI